MTALSDLLAEHQPRSYYRCRCSWQGDRFDVHLHDVLAAAANRTAVVAGLVEAGVLVRPMMVTPDCDDHPVSDGRYVMPEAMSTWEDHGMADRDWQPLYRTGSNRA